jgi:hypothetical protein
MFLRIIADAAHSRGAFKWQLPGFTRACVLLPKANHCALARSLQKAAKLLAI